MWTNLPEIKLVGNGTKGRDPSLCYSYDQMCDGWGALPAVSLIAVEIHPLGGFVLSSGGWETKLSARPSLAQPRLPAKYPSPHGTPRASHWQIPRLGHVLFLSRYRLSHCNLMPDDRDGKSTMCRLWRRFKVWLDTDSCAPENHLQTARSSITLSCLDRLT